MHSLLRIMATLMVAAVAFAQPADAQTKMDHSKHKMGEGMHMATGTIVMVNKSKGMLVIDHDPIEGLMDAMTMGFKVANPDLLGKVKDGDKVEFMLRAKDMTVTDISKADSMKMKKMDGCLLHCDNYDSKGLLHMFTQWNADLQMFEIFTFEAKDFLHKGYEPLAWALPV